MPRRKRQETSVDDYRHDATRVNIPPAGLAAQGKVREVPTAHYAYDPHLPPVLRFDPTGQADKLPELLAEAQRRKLTEEEAKTLAEALRNRQPWLEWAGKREARWFDVDPVALHIHERVSAQAIVKLAARQPLQRSLFADPELEYRQAVQFYQRDVDWANRLILGDSLTVMHSLARRENLAGKVQMIYMDPPYGIKFASNFQPFVTRRTVRDRDQDLTREPEQVKAYRDTWTLGVHSYLAYLRDRLIVARELLADSGSIFVQISDENLHRVRMVMDEVFGSDNSCQTIVFRKKLMPLGAKLLEGMYDYILWYAKDTKTVKFSHLFKHSLPRVSSRWTNVELANGQRRKLTHREALKSSLSPKGARVYRLVSQRAPSFSETGVYAFEFKGHTFTPPQGGCWVTTKDKMQRMASCSRLESEGDNLSYVYFHDDFPYSKITNFWSDTSPVQGKLYVVQTTGLAIQRCMLMTTDPGDLALDPTCGSGTTAYVAERWGRRWITIDTSRVAVALARQRLLTAKYDYYRLADPQDGPESGFIYRTVPHITLKSIAQNPALDPIFDEWEPILAGKLAALNAALATVDDATRRALQAKLAEKERRQGKRAITQADRRRWLLPRVLGVSGWQPWQVPYDSDPDWPEPLRVALDDYRRAWRGKMEEVNATIAASAPQETLVDQPEVVRKVVRVSGPFTVEGVQPAEETLELETPIGGAPESLTPFLSPASGRETPEEPANAAAFIERMIRLLRQDGVRFPGNRVQRFSRLEPLSQGVLHAEGEWSNGQEGNLRQVAVSVGPQYGPVTVMQVEEGLRAAYRRGYDDLVFAGFAFDGAAQAIIQEDPNPAVRCHLAHIRPDVTMGDLLKNTSSSQLFTVFGLPRVALEPVSDGEWVVEMQGVDVYNPVDNTLQATGADKVAAWFLDGDYDGRTFCISQAFFPDSSAWNKLARALKTTVDPQRFAAFSGTRSLPFPAGEHRRVAVKAIDPRGNEALRVLPLDREARYG